MPRKVSYKLIPGFEDYRVGDDGSVWSRRPYNSKGDYSNMPWRRLSPRTSTGRARLFLCRAGEKLEMDVSVIVLTAFISGRPAGMEVCHDPDPNPLNNNLSNLRWGTRKENAEDMVRHGRSSKGVRRPMAKLNDNLVRVARERVRRGESCRKVAKEVGVSQSTLSRAVAGDTWKHV